MLSYFLALKMALIAPVSQPEAESEAVTMTVPMRKAGYTVLAFDGDELVGELTPCGILPVVVDDDFTTPVVLTLEADRMRHEV